MAASFCALLGSEGFATSGSRWDLSRSLAAVEDISAAVMLLRDGEQCLTWASLEFSEIGDVCFPERVFGGCKCGAEWAIFGFGLVNSPVVEVVVMVAVAVVGCTGVSLVARLSGFVLGALRGTSTSVLIWKIGWEERSCLELYYDFCSALPAGYLPPGGRGGGESRHFMV